MPFEPIRKILPRVVGNHGIQSPLKARNVLQITTTVLRALWGEEKAANVTPVSFHEAELRVESSSAGAVQQLRMDEARLLNEINRTLGERAVKHLSVRRKGF